MPFVLSEGVKCRSTCNKEAVFVIISRRVLLKRVVVRITDPEAVNGVTYSGVLLKRVVVRTSELEAG